MSDSEVYAPSSSSDVSYVTFRSIEEGTPLQGGKSPTATTRKFRFPVSQYAVFAGLVLLAFAAYTTMGSDSTDLSRYVQSTLKEGSFSVKPAQGAANTMPEEQEPGWKLVIEEKKAKKDALKASKKAHDAIINTPSNEGQEPSWKLVIEEKKAKKDALKTKQKSSVINGETEESMVPEHGPYYDSKHNSQKSIQSDSAVDHSSKKNEDKIDEELKWGTTKALQAKRKAEKKLEESKKKAHFSKESKAHSEEKSKGVTDTPLDGQPDIESKKNDESSEISQTPATTDSVNKAADPIITIPSETGTAIDGANPAEPHSLDNKLGPGGIVYCNELVSLNRYN